MPRVVIAPAIQRHVACPACEVDASTVGEALASVFTLQPMLRGYLLDDQGGLRRHVAVFIDGVALRDRRRLDEAVPIDGEIYVAQALSGG